MYEQYYSLREKPFALSPDPAYLYLAKRHRHALTLLEYALTQSAGFALITGEVGCGKTTVVQHFLGRTKGRLNVGLINNAHPGFGALLPWVMESFGLDAGQTTPSELYRRFASYVRQKYADGERTVLVIDEAQNLGIGGLEELRVLSNLNVGKELLLQTILIGQPELRAALQLQALRQLAQRIAIDHHLEALRLEETLGYVRHRLTVAGGRPDLFTPEAIRLVHECTGGVPRLVNLVCDTALVYGFAEQRANITPDLIEQVVADRASGGLLPLRVAGAGAQGSLATV
jgi:type II secretory pathway predicted ATPase ExeA